VRQTGHRYLENIEEREEGGTPAIVGAIRAGLVFQLKAAVTLDLIMEKEHYLFR
jgi:selenocysteine lyase/cysteine desulfurase